MAERTNIPATPACGQWETLLADALDGLLSPADEVTFNNHKMVCPACTELYEEARRGQEWLQFLAPEPEVPEGLLDKILAQTGPGQVAGYGLVTEGGNVLRMPPVVIPAWQRPGLMAQVRRFAEPRLLMTAAMAFFSITLTLNLTGVRLTDLHWANLKPTAIRSIVERRLTTASTPIIRYYDHLRFVYEVESRMRELRRTSEGQSGEGRSGESKSKDTAPSGSGESKKTPAMKDDGSRMDPPQQSIGTGQGPTSKPEKGGARIQSSNSDFFEASLTFQEQPAHSGGSVMAVRERSTVWTA